MIGFGGLHGVWMMTHCVQNTKRLISFRQELDWVTYMKHVLQQLMRCAPIKHIHKYCESCVPTSACLPEMLQQTTSRM